MKPSPFLTNWKKFELAARIVCRYSRCAYSPQTKGHHAYWLAYQVFNSMWYLDHIRPLRTLPLP